MRPQLDRACRISAVILGIATLVSVVALLVWDTVPQRFASDAHRLLGGLPLTLIAVAYIVYQAGRRPGWAELAKAILLAAAFLFWAANQFWPLSTHATLYNDLAIALFVLDIFFVIAGWPASAPQESFAESYVEETRS